MRSTTIVGRSCTFSIAYALQRTQVTVISVNYIGTVSYTEAIERSTMNGGDDGAGDYPLFACCCISYQPLLAYVNQLKELGSSDSYG